MRLKQYLGGFGAGVIVSASVLTIANAVTTNTTASEDNTSAYISYTVQEENGDTISSDTNNSTEAETEAVTEMTTEATTEAETEATTEAATEATTEATTAASTTATIEIVSGTSTKEVFNIIYNAGVISDVSAFSKYMYDTGYDTKIRIGTYTLTKGDSYENIAKIITQQ